MDYLLAKNKGKTGCYYKLLADKTVFDEIPDFTESREYQDDYKLQDNEWFVVEQFSQKSYSGGFIQENFVATSFSFMPKDKYQHIDHIVSVQGDHKIFVFQKITPSFIYEKQKTISWGAVVHPSDQAQLSMQQDVLVIRNDADCFYLKEEDKLYFKKLSSLTTIFAGINILYKEATNEEVIDFLNMDILKVASSFNENNVKTANRRKIKEGTERYNSFSQEQKDKIPQYLAKYCPNSYNEQTKRFNVEDEKGLTNLLNVFNQRYYTTEIDNEKRLANSVTAL